jgi:hypothetical protein
MEDENISGWFAQKNHDQGQKGTNLYQNGKVNN